VDAVDPLAVVLRPSRTVGGWSAPRGIDTTCLPWRLWEKAKRLAWDPASIDLSVDAEHWAALPLAYQDAMLHVCTGFLVGEEAVTLDIVPLALAVADEGRLEEAMYLTSFAFEEAKHVEFFRRWLDAVGADLDGYYARLTEQAAGLGLLYDPAQSVGMWESALPTAMRRVLVDRSPAAMLDASVTYNQFVEGCLAISGYTLWADLFALLDSFPGMQQGIRHIRADEGRHITYGTYLCQRILAEHPELLDGAITRLRDLATFWFEVSPTIDDPADPISTQLSHDFATRVHDQVERRAAVLARAATMTVDELERTGAAEAAERELLGID
jgi:ribonucleoside-diphosphate reductase beta chain